MPNAKFFIDPTLAGMAGPYYNLYPVEPTPSSITSDWIKSDGKPVFPKTKKLDEWLTAIAGAGGGNIVLVCHGTNDGLTLHIGDKGVTLFIEALDAIRLNQEGKKSNVDTAQILKMEPDAYGTLKALIERVQKLKLNRVDVRACEIGQNDVVMSALQQFFNCNTFCAPKLLDSFGHIDWGQFVKDPATFDKWVKEHRGAEISGSVGNRFGFSIVVRVGVRLQAIAESANGVKAWADSKMPPGGNFTGHNQLFYHALITDVTKFVFAGEPAFRAELKEATKGNVPSRKIDLKKVLPTP